MNPYLIPAGSDSEERWTGERCFIRERLNDAKSPALSVATARVAAGTTTELHSLDVDEWYLIGEGQGRMEIGDEPPFDVGPGDSVFIPAGRSQRIANTGASDLVFDCVCTPRFTPESYTALE